MPLPTTNLSLDAIHVEVGGSTGTTVSLNDTDVRALNYPKPSYNEGSSGLGSSGTFIAMGELREGYETLSNPEGTWVVAKLSALSSGQWSFYVRETDEAEGEAVAEAGVTLKVVETGSALEIWLNEDGDYQRARLANNSIVDPGVNYYKIWSYSFGEFSGFSAKLNYSSTQQDGSANLDTSINSLTSTSQSLSSDRLIKFSTEVTADNGEGSVDSEWSIDCTVTLERWGFGITKAFRLWILAAAESTGEGGEEECIHEDMLIATEEDMKSIHNIEIGDSVVSYNFETGQNELVEVEDKIIVERGGDYKVNNLILTKDHPIYLETKRKASVKPHLTLTNYEQEVDELKLGDVMKKLDGTTEEITSIEKYEGKHINYTIKTKHNNFYANNILVSSVEIRKDKYPKS